MTPVRGQPHATAEHEAHASNGVTARQLLFAQFTLLAITASLYFLGFALYLYWVFWWYDIVLHVFGGAWAALAMMWVFAAFGKTHAGTSLIGIVIVIGIAWELFEGLIGAPRESKYLFDTSLDLLMDVFGALFALWIVNRRTRRDEREKHDTILIHD